MSPSVDDVFRAALALPPENRANLATQLLESLDAQAEAGVDAAWASEVESRLRSYERGETKAIPGDEVFRALRERKKP